MRRQTGCSNVVLSFMPSPHICKPRKAGFGAGARPKRMSLLRRLVHKKSQRGSVFDGSFAKRILDIEGTHEHHR